MKAQKELANLEAEIGLSFSNPDLLAQALTHGSYINEYPEANLADNQRLEFLGDAILDFVVGEWLFHRYPDADEGELTSLRARIVRTHSLANLAREFSLGNYLRLGRGEAASGGRRRAANLCAAFEALVGAIYLDQGIEVARRWVEDILERHAGEFDAQRRAKDAKSRLQEFTQAYLHVTPSYRLVRTVGPDHAKVFTSQTVIDGRVWGEGTGTTKQSAEQAAAAAALEALQSSELIERSTT
ncbi:MAG: ribonuclease III [Chloroflexi bacterium]|nr:ribonuclease III [Chloroflexota bacterium]